MIDQSAGRLSSAYTRLTDTAEDNADRHPRVGLAAMGRHPKFNDQNHGVCCLRSSEEHQ